jgi:predicted PurR-regulated permease PerM
MDRALDVALRLAFVALIVAWCFRIITPFFMPVLWGAIIAVAFYPVFLKLKASLGDRNRMAGTLFILVTLALIITPTVFLTESLIGGATRLGEGLDEGTLVVPPPSESVQEWPVVGERLYVAWSQAATDLEASLNKYAPQLKAVAQKLIGLAASFGGAVIQTIFSLIIAGIFMMNAVGSGRIAYAVAERFGGAKGREMVDISIATIRSVVKGVLLVALIQSVLAAVGLVFAGVPAAGFWAFLVLVVAIVQLPPILILGPIAAYVFANQDSTVVAVIFLVWSLVVSGSDGFLKPIFLGRGVAVPMIIILIGAIGGMIAHGVVGLFVGAVILSLGYKLVEAWMGDSLKKGEPGVATNGHGRK